MPPRRVRQRAVQCTMRQHEDGRARGRCVRRGPAPLPHRVPGFCQAQRLHHQALADIPAQDQRQGQMFQQLLAPLALRSADEPYIYLIDNRPLQLCLNCAVSKYRYLTFFASNFFAQFRFSLNRFSRSFSSSKACSIVSI